MRCKACGDPGRYRFEGAFYCRECFQELKHGYINHTPVHFIGGHTDPVRHEEGDEMEPLQEQMYHDLEG